jgi:N-acetylmuramate 1-kinase
MHENTALKAWAARIVNCPNISLQPLAGDASFRAYYRFEHNNMHYLLMDAAKEKESIKSFIGVATEFEHKGLPVPKVFAHDQSLGFVLLTDFGDQLLLNQLNAGNVDQWYSQAMQLLSPLLAIPHKTTYAFPLFDEHRILRELNTFHEWCIDKLLGFELNSNMAKLLNETYAALVESALEQPKVMVHLDYHSRNLMIQRDTGTLGIIDFQDAVIGPVTYDLVSLTKDCYITWPSTSITVWVKSYYQQAIDCHVFQEKDVSFEKFRTWYDWMGLQRHLKVLGVFSRLKLRDQKDGYIKDMPRVLRYILTVTQQDARLHAFHQFLETEIQPRLQAYWLTQGIETAA